MVHHIVGTGLGDGGLLHRIAQQPHHRFQVEQFVLLAIARRVSERAKAIVAIAIQHQAAAAVGQLRDSGNGQRDCVGGLSRHVGLERDEDCDERGGHHPVWKAG